MDPDSVLWQYELRQPPSFLYQQTVGWGMKVQPFLESPPWLYQNTEKSHTFTVAQTKKEQVVVVLISHFSTLFAQWLCRQWPWPCSSRSYCPWGSHGLPICLSSCGMWWDIWWHCETQAVLIKVTLDQQAESMTSWQELAMENMEEPGIWLETHMGRNREELGDSWPFLVLNG